ncbi:MAG TPA: DUF2071 domain-containing protein [Fimbriimonas sp.]|nr:DUF2071 domain-containing protein [Fimbriimonas sp.]
MKLPTLAGTIKRRILLNYRADPDVVERLLPKPFTAQIHRGFAIVGVCLIRLEQERPAGFPEALGFSSENAAHRMAVQWPGPGGETSTGVYIPRRDTDSVANRLAGGRLFPAESHAARFAVCDRDGRIEFSMRSTDREVQVSVTGTESDRFPQGSVFESLEEASRFFESGCVGYSPCSGYSDFDGIELWTPSWKVNSLEISEVHSSYFADESLFPAGSIAFDHALIMRDIQHEWRTVSRLSGGANSAKSSSPGA